ncbi:hypothetical protein H1C71_035752, partial [Ictidomys tridecemlineatus]
DFWTVLKSKKLIKGPSHQMLVTSFLLDLSDMRIPQGGFEVQYGSPCTCSPFHPLTLQVLVCPGGLSSNAGEAGDCRLAEGSSYDSAWLGTWPHQPASSEQGPLISGSRKSGLLSRFVENLGNPLVLIWNSPVLPSHFLPKRQESRCSVLFRK